MPLQLLEDYSVSRCDEECVTFGKKTGGGVLIAVISPLHGETSLSSSPSIYNSVRVQLIPSNLSYPVYIFLASVPLPCTRFSSIDYQKSQSFYSAHFLSSFVETLMFLYSPDLLLPHCSHPVFTFMYTCAVLQLILSRNHLHRAFDLFLSNLPVGCISRSIHAPSYVDPDAHHPALELNAQISRLHSPFARKPTKFTFRKANFVGLNSALVTIN